MAYRYRCGACQQTWPFMGRSDAEGVQHQHRADVHGGAVPDGEELQSNAERANPVMWLYILGVCVLLWIADRIDLVN